MTEYQDLGHCQRCRFEWVIGDATRYGQPRRGSRDKPPTLQCPFCNSEQVEIKKERKE